VGTVIDELHMERGRRDTQLLESLFNCC